MNAPAASNRPIPPSIGMHGGLQHGGPPAGTDPAGGAPAGGDPPGGPGMLYAVAEIITAANKPTNFLEIRKIFILVTFSLLKYYFFG